MCVIPAPLTGCHGGQQPLGHCSRDFNCIHTHTDTHTLLWKKIDEYLHVSLFSYSLSPSCLLACPGDGQVSRSTCPQAVLPLFLASLSLSLSLSLSRLLVPTSSNAQKKSGPPLFSFVACLWFSLFSYSFFTLFFVSSLCCRLALFHRLLVCLIISIVSLYPFFSLLSFFIYSFFRSHSHTRTYIPFHHLPLSLPLLTLIYTHTCVYACMCLRSESAHIAQKDHPTLASSRPPLARHSTCAAPPHTQA